MSTLPPAYQEEPTGLFQDPGAPQESLEDQMVREIGRANAKGQSSGRPGGKDSGLLVTRREYDMRPCMQTTFDEMCEELHEIYERTDLNFQKTSNPIGLSLAELQRRKGTLRTLFDTALASADGESDLPTWRALARQTAEFIKRTESARGGVNADDSATDTLPVPSVMRVLVDLWDEHQAGALEGSMSFMSLA